MEPFARSDWNQINGDIRQNKSQHMNTLTSLNVGKTVAAITIAVMTSTAFATDNRAPETPKALRDPLVGQKVHFHGNAIGVQIYRWNGAAWAFVAPEAVLFDNDGNVVAIHYAGPTWESSSGSFVVGARVAGATVDPTAIPWLLLAGVNSGGPGVLNGTTFIQRVNTVGGLAPTAPGINVGDEARVYYEAEYFFYRQEN
jgi:hypothetical protein